MKIEPMHDRILISRTETQEKSPGGIIIPENAKEKPQEGTVVAVGPGKIENGTRVPMTVEEGDRVLFGKYAGTEVSLNGKEYILVRSDEIFARYVEVD